MKYLKLASVLGFAVLGGVLISATPAETPRQRPADAELVSATPAETPLQRHADAELERVTPIDGLTGKMFGAHAVSQAAPHRDIIIMSAVSAEGERTEVRVRSGTVAVFRADAARDDFTKQGGWHWKSGDDEHRTQFESSRIHDGWMANGKTGALILVVHQHDGIVHWYSLHPDLRC